MSHPQTVGCVKGFIHARPLIINVLYRIQILVMKTFITHCEANLKSLS